MSAPRICSGKVNRDSIYSWLNPEYLNRAQRYARARLLGDFVEVDADTYDYFLDMMSPVRFTHVSFAICEATTGDIRLAFFRVGGRHFAAHVSDAASMADARQDITAAMSVAA